MGSRLASESFDSLDQPLCCVSLRNGNATASSPGKPWMEAQLAKMRSELEKAHRTHLTDMEQAKQSQRDLRMALDEAQATKYQLSLELQTAHQESIRLRDELVQTRKETQNTLAAHHGVDSEGRLRIAMANPNVSIDDLRSAIAGVEAIAGEARRELERKEQRQKRAAFEQLGAAIDKNDETQIETALVLARTAGLASHDIQKAEEALDGLRSRTDEQKAARAARELEYTKKKEAFLLVKRDEAKLLQELLDGLEKEVRWMDWRDYAGRTLWKCAHDFKTEHVQSVLAPRLSVKSSANGKALLSSVAALNTHDEQSKSEARRASRAQSFADGNSLQDTSSFDRPRSRTRFTFTRGSSISRKSDADSVASWWNGDASVEENIDNGAVPEAPIKEEETMTDTLDGRIPESPIETEQVLSDVELEQLKSKALRAVVQDDTETLDNVLVQVPKKRWSLWQNKAGKDLVLLSEERGASHAHAALLKAMGVLEEQKRDTFLEREDVWIFRVGDVQPQRAVVLEDVPEEADKILIEYWDGDDPPVYVDRAMVRKDYNSYSHA